MTRTPGHRFPRGPFRSGKPKLGGLIARGAGRRPLYGGKALAGTLKDAPIWNHDALDEPSAHFRFLRSQWHDSPVDSGDRPLTKSPRSALRERHAPHAI